MQVTESGRSIDPFDPTYEAGHNTLASVNSSTRLRKSSLLAGAAIVAASLLSNSGNRTEAGAIFNDESKTIDVGTVFDHQIVSPVMTLQKAEGQSFELAIEPFTTESHIQESESSSIYIPVSEAGISTSIAELNIPVNEQTEDITTSKDIQDYPIEGDVAVLAEGNKLTVTAFANDKNDGIDAMKIAINGEPIPSEDLQCISGVSEKEEFMGLECKTEQILPAGSYEVSMEAQNPKGEEISDTEITEIKSPIVQEIKGHGFVKGSEYGKMVVDFIRTQEDFTKVYADIYGADAVVPDFDEKTQVIVLAAVAADEGMPALKLLKAQDIDGKTVVELDYSSASIQSREEYSAEGRFDHIIAIVEKNETVTARVMYPGADEPFYSTVYLEEDREFKLFFPDLTSGTEAVDSPLRGGLTSPESGDIKGNSVHISGSAVDENDGLASFEIRVNGQAVPSEDMECISSVGQDENEQPVFSPMECNISIELADGEHEITLTATNPKGEEVTDIKNITVGNNSANV